VFSDDVEALLAGFPEGLFAAIIVFLDSLDRTYRDLTVTASYLVERRTDRRWW
jgi:hypothetical protein